MYTFKLSNPNYIRKFLDRKPDPDEIKEIVVEVSNVDAFLGDLLDDLAEDTDWPLAVPPKLIVDPNDPEASADRARTILDIALQEQDVFGLNILDFGCGTGYVAAEALSRGARKVTGLDVVADPIWDTLAADNLTLTTNWKSVLEGGPYDFIILYDVIDHIVDREPKDVLTDLAELLSKDGTMFLRCHPWIGRHGGHLYYKLNRAFAHVIFDEAMLKSRGYDGPATRKVIHPMLSYKNWIQKAGLSIIKDDKITDQLVEDYFLKNGLLRAMIQKHFKNSPMDDYREGRGDLGRILSFQCVDFWLKR